MGWPSPNIATFDHGTYIQYIHANKHLNKVFLHPVSCFFNQIWHYSMVSVSLRWTNGHWLLVRLLLAVHCGARKLCSDNHALFFTFSLSQSLSVLDFVWIYIYNIFLRSNIFLADCKAWSKKEVLYHGIHHHFLVQHLGEDFFVGKSPRFWDLVVWPLDKLVSLTIPAAKRSKPWNLVGRLEG